MFIKLYRKKINELNDLYSIKAELINDNICRVDNVNGSFLDRTYQDIYFRTNQNGSVEYVTIFYRKIIDNSFYESLLEEYGKPDNILVVNNVLAIEEGENGEQLLIDSTFSLKEGSFEDKPLYIIWNKQDYTIKVELNYEKNKTNITFGVDSM